MVSLPLRWCFSLLHHLRILRTRTEQILETFLLLLPFSIVVAYVSYPRRSISAGSIYDTWCPSSCCCRWEIVNRVSVGGAGEGESREKERECPEHLGRNTEQEKKKKRNGAGCCVCWAHAAIGAPFTTQPTGRGGPRTTYSSTSHSGTFLRFEEISLLMDSRELSTE